MNQQAQLPPQSCCCADPDCRVNGCRIHREHMQRLLAEQGQRREEDFRKERSFPFGLMAGPAFGMDPMLRLADAINRLCDLVERS